MGPLRSCDAIRPPHHLCSPARQKTPAGQDPGPRQQPKTSLSRPSHTISKRSDQEPKASHSEPEIAHFRNRSKIASSRESARIAANSVCLRRPPAVAGEPDQFCRASSLIGRPWGQAISDYPPPQVSMSLAGSCFSSESAPRPIPHCRKPLLSAFGLQNAVTHSGQCHFRRVRLRNFCRRDDAKAESPALLSSICLRGTPSARVDWGAGYHYINL